MMTFALALAAICRHPFSVAVTLLFASVTAALLGTAIALGLALWAATTLIAFELWYALEPIALRRLGGCRPPSNAERQRLASALGHTPLCLLIADTSDLALVRGLRSLVITRDLLEVLDDRALGGLLRQSVTPVHVANLAGFGLVWIGNLPLLVAWVATRMVSQLGRLAALMVGTSLVVPLVLFRDGFLRWGGRVFTAILVGLSAAVLLVSGFTAAGFGLALAWLLIPLMDAILAWESRRAEARADRGTVGAGMGLQLLEAVDFLALAEPLPPLDGLLRLLSVPRTSTRERAERIRRDLGLPHSMQ